MASRGAHVAGTDGGDSEYRMNIEARYGKLPPLKRRLSAVHIVQWVYFGLLLLELLYNQTTGRVDRQTKAVNRLHYGLFVAIVVPLLGRNAIAKNNEMLLTVYSLLSGLTAAYVIFFGVGYTARLLNEQGLTRDLSRLATLFIDVYGFAANIYGAILSRQIMALTRNIHFRRFLEKTQGKKK